jgi:hypothetical protein
MISIDEAPYAVTARLALRGGGDDASWRTAKIIWHERHGSYAAVLAITDSYSYKFWHLHLLLRCLDGKWFPVEDASSSRWAAYEAGRLRGVAMEFDESICAAGQRVRFRFGSREGDAKVNAGHLCIVRWDLDQAELGKRLEFLKVRVGNRWVPCVTSEVPATAAQFGEAYLNLRRDYSKHVWAWSALQDRFEWEYRLKLVMAVVQHARLPQHEEALGQIGVGALEDMMSDWLLDQLERYLPFDKPLQYALSNVRMDFEPDALRDRLNRMVTT